MACTDKEFDIALPIIFELATKHIVEYSYKDDPEKLQKEMFEPELRMKA